ncbi:NAD-dependent succinate-semialdehyde dehydrogenase [Undibacterium squillarum]|uniref:NAD-dependent succinate-semialdehyde dehydrogenase n=2 Tax=Undibacterium squillarum TaxID=1131567 RepID=A0ABQ2XZG4_9BURK|nr:NAD-dependent succinate-semialdehyde dehydrogenase [Undibacterium squillarum]
MDLLQKLNAPDLLKTGVMIANQWRANADTFDVTNPASGSLVARVAQSSVQDAEQAITSANAAFPAWAALTGKARAGILRRWYELVVAHADDLALIMTTEQGKPLAEAKAEVIYGASFLEWFAEEAKRVSGDVMASTWTDKRTLVLKQPVGVCAAITPWNFPLAMITRKVAPAIAAGCTIIVKPAEQTPLSALALAELAIRAGMPEGVMNILPADSQRSVEIGTVLCDSPVIRHLSFTGSTPVGRILMRQSASTVKKLALELGGHAPFIVFDDADLDAAVEGALQSKYRNAGQTCVCTNRFYVQENIYDAFVEKFSEAVKRIRVGDGLAPETQQGPVIDEQAICKIELHVADAVSKGAKLVAGGRRIQADTLFFEPTVLADVPEDALIMSEETFGPVAAIARFSGEQQVIAAANHTDSGLASYFFSRDMTRIWRVAEQLEYGMVGINTGLISNEVAPFGGVKQSGLGREGSKYGIDEYLEMKYLCIGGIR